MRDLPVVTVNILAFNRRDEVRRTLGVVFGELDYPNDRLEVIVVDNASSDGTAEMVRSEFSDVQVIRNDVNVGVSGWNRGFEQGKGDWFLALDDDCYITGDALRRAVAAAIEHEADLVSFAVKSSIDESFYFSRDYHLGLLGFWGCAVLMSKRAVRTLGGFDEDMFIWANELEFTIRLLDAGMGHLHFPEVVAIHQKEPPEDVPREVAESHLTMNTQNFAYVAAKLLRAGDAALALSSIFTRALALLPKEPGPAARMLASALRGLRKGLARRLPVRREVSRLYRRNYLEFVSPLRFTRTPREIIRARGDRMAELESFKKRRDRFWRDREELYPEETGTFRI